MNSSNIWENSLGSWRIGIGKARVNESESWLPTGFQNLSDQKKSGHRLNWVNESASCLCKRGKLNWDGSIDMVNVSYHEIVLDKLNIRYLVQVSYIVPGGHLLLSSLRSTFQ
jgi:hypothetical protein